jgi:hypothetical protein
MHLIIILSGAFGQKALFYFMILKTLADLIMHAIEHSLGKKSKPKAATEEQKS